MDDTEIHVLDDTQLRRQTRCDSWLTPGRFAALLGLFIFCLFPAVLLGTQTFFFRDYGIFGYPLAAYHRECFWRGELPLWNPLSNCGLPYLAQWNTLTLYPLSLVYLLLPLPWSLSFFCLLHLFLAGLGMYFLAFSWTNNRLAAGIAGFAFAFNGLTLQCLMWPNNIAGLAWMPWVIWRTQLAWKEGGRHIIIAGVVGAVQMLSGAPEIILFTWLIAGLLWILNWRESTAGRLNHFTRALGVVVLLLGLSAAQLFPFLDLLVHCERDSNFGDGTWTMPIWGWLNLLLPLFKCYQSPAGPFFQPRQGWTSSYYEGIAVLALALYAARFVRDRRVTLLWLLTLAGLVIALGDNGLLYTAVRHLVPALGFMRFPIKFVLLMIFALPLLAAFAVAHLRAIPLEDAGQEQRAKRWSGLIALLLLLVICGAAFYGFTHPFANLKTGTLGTNAIARLACVAIVFTLLFRSRSEAASLKQKTLQICLLAALGIDAWTHAPNQNPTVAPSVYEMHVVARELKADQETGPRALTTRNTHDVLYGSMISDPAKDFTGRRYGLFGNCNLLDGIPTTDGFYSLYLTEQRELWTRLFFATNFPTGLADFLGVSRISTNVFDWQPRVSAQSLVSIGAAPIFADRKETVHGLLNPAFDPKGSVFLPPEARGAVAVSSRSTGEILSTSHSSSSVSIRAKATEPAFVVIAQSWYHRWQGAVDGKPAKIWRANHAFQAIEMPAGEHEVSLVYKDEPFRFGASISGLSVAGCIIGWLRLRRRTENPASE